MVGNSGRFVKVYVTHFLPISSMLFYLFMFLFVVKF